MHLNDIWEYTLVRNLTVVLTVNFLVLNQVIWRNTWEFTLERNLTNALNVISLAPDQIIWHIMWQCIQRKRIKLALNVIFLAFNLKILENGNAYWWVIFEVQCLKESLILNQKTPQNLSAKVQSTFRDLLLEHRSRGDYKSGKQGRSTKKSSLTFWTFTPTL